MKRVFLAISFKKSDFISQYIKDIKSKLAAENIKWVEDDYIHLTLKYFGPTDDLGLKRIKNSLERVLKEQHLFELSFNRLGVFGSKYQPRVLWMGLKQADELSILAERLKLALKEIGIYPDRQNFVPHITIGRIKHLDSKKYFQSVVNQYKDFDSGIIPIKRVYLYQSILHKDGPEYRVLQEYSLKSLNKT
ncbi:MAG: RNA 2',3'-cyclic phosphodiesterase [Bacteroidales bacterium]|nr:RNA 2',3'-cyclic phosphodiesterase [Bacteroidales bacterium]